ncbi:MAG: hypothetical protein ACFFC1_03665 [Promethearchaeota archaeon]
MVEMNLFTEVMQYIIPVYPMVMAFIIQQIKKWIDRKRAKECKNKIKSKVWVGMAWASGLVIVLFLYGMKDFQPFNWFQFIWDIFLYSAGTAFMYTNYNKFLIKKE